MRTHAIRETVSRRGFQNEASMRISFADTTENEPPQGSENGVTLDGKVSMVMPFFFATLSKKASATKIIIGQVRTWIRCDQVETEIWLSPRMDGWTHS